MNYERMEEIIEAQFERVRELRRTKGKEYAQDEDTLADFKEVAAEVGITPLQCWAVYVKKHLRAIDTFIREGEVKSESIGSRIDDVLTYYSMLSGLVQDERGGASPAPDYNALRCNSWYCGVQCDLMSGHDGSHQHTAAVYGDPGQLDRTYKWTDFMASPPQVVTGDPGQPFLKVEPLELVEDAYPIEELLRQMPHNVGLLAVEHCARDSGWCDGEICKTVGINCPNADKGNDEGAMVEVFPPIGPHPSDHFDAVHVAGADRRDQTIEAQTYGERPFYAWSFPVKFEYEGETWGAAAQVADQFVTATGRDKDEVRASITQAVKSHLHWMNSVHGVTRCPFCHRGVQCQLGILHLGDHEARFDGKRMFYPGDLRYVQPVDPDDDEVRERDDGDPGPMEDAMRKATNVWTEGIAPQAREQGYNDPRG